MRSTHCCYQSNSWQLCNTAFNIGWDSWIPLVMTNMPWKQVGLLGNFKFLSHSLGIHVDFCTNRAALLHYSIQRYYLQFKKQKKLQLSQRVSYEGNGQIVPLKTFTKRISLKSLLYHDNARFLIELMMDHHHTIHSHHWRCTDKYTLKQKMSYVRRLID